MHGIYQAKHAFKRSIADAGCKGAPARSTPTSPNSHRGGSERPSQPSTSVRTCVAKLSSRLEKCSSEPSVFDRTAKPKEAEAKPADKMSTSITGLPSCESSDQDSRTDLFRSHLGASENDLIISFEKGDLFQVLSKEEAHRHWWAVRCVASGRLGFVPANYLEPRETSCPQPPAQDGNCCALLYELRSRVAGAVFPAAMIPEPDVCAPVADLEKRNRRNTSGAPLAPPLPPFSAEGLILPRKPVNPCLESADHKNLHRELLFNHKIGKNVLNQKSELQKALEKHKELQVKKEIQHQKESSKSALERVIEERAKRLEMLQKPEEAVKSQNGAPEFLQVHAKLRARMDSK